MPLHHAEVSAQRRTIDLAFGELGSLKVTYNPGKMTPDFQVSLQADPDEAKGVGEARFIAAVVLEWDYLDEKDKPFPLEAKALQGVSFMILDRVVTEVFKDLNPPPKPSESSGSFS